MGDPDSVQLARLVDGDDPEASIAEAGRIFRYWYAEADWAPVRAAVSATLDLFAGRFPGYRACDTEYHDIRHTLAVLLTTARFADGLFIEHGPYPADLTRDLFVAATFHDVGYIRAVDEEGGTGARFTSVHVQRSADFARTQAPALGGLDGVRVARIIAATGLKGEFEDQTWGDDLEREAGRVLASADLVGQMSDRAYLEKLLFLYREFKEAGFPGYDTEFDILRKTMGFYKMTVDRLDGAMGGVRSHVRSHFAKRYGIDKDLCAEAMDRQIDYLRGILDDASTDFRKKLKRMDFELSQPKTA